MTISLSWWQAVLFILISTKYQLSSGQNTANLANSNGLSYTIYVAKAIRPGFDITLSVSVSNSKNPVLADALLSSSDGEIYFQETVVIQSGSSSQITLGRLPIGYSGSRSFNLTVIGRDSQTLDNLFMESTTDFDFKSKSVSILIQTDKAIYQPGQKIKFRGLCFFPDLRPLQGSVSYKVEDPNGNTVLQERNVSLNNGVAGGELQLTRSISQGQWKVIFEYENVEEMITVEVERYNLPRFEVSINAPSYIYPGSPGFTATVKATYTFGQLVSGYAVVRLQTRGRGFNFGNNGRTSIVAKRFYNFDGDESVFIPGNAINNSLGWDGDRDVEFEVFAEVTETLTETTFNKSEIIKAQRSKIKVEVLQQPEVAKPGLSYQALVRVSEQDGTLLSERDRQGNNLIFTVRYQARNFQPRPLPFLPAPLISPAISPVITPVGEVEESYVFEVPLNGLVRVSVPVPEENFESIQFQAYTNTTEEIYRYNTWTAVKANSPSDSFLQITVTESTAGSELRVGDTAQVVIRTTDSVSSIRILILARGQIVRDEQHLVTDPSSLQTTYSFVITSEMSPSLLLLASYNGPKNEIVADYVRLNVEVGLENQVSIDTSNSTVDAGSFIIISVNTSSPNAYVGLRAVDQSVLLLRTGNDVTRQRVFDELEEYSDDRPNFGDISPRFSIFWYPRPSGATDAKSVFDQADLIVLTNALVYQSKRPISFFQSRFPAFAAQSLGRPIDARLEAVSVAAPAPPPSGSRVRTLFPETWLWNEGITKNDSSVSFYVQVPETITSWIISAFSMSDVSGLGVADTSRLTVFRNFFVSLNLPLKITRGEIIIVQAIIFNYLDTDLRAIVRLSLLPGYNVTLLRPGGETLSNRDIRIISIPAGGSASVRYPLRIDSLGEVPIRVFAWSTGVIDAVERKVFVKPEGIQQCYSVSSLIDIHMNTDEGIVADQFVVRIPSGIVPGSGQVTLNAYGDILGSTMSNLGSLLRAPGGCGEQNMLSFAPDVFITLYLQRVQKLTPEIEMEAFQHISDGYMNELQYKRDDGSFSAFGSRDKSGSTWLTAFVVKTLLFAREVRPLLIDEEIIDDAINFLVAQQNSVGSFKEPGRVIHRNMQGGVNSPITLTAYIVIALSETNITDSELEWEFSLDSATLFLESNLNITMNDTYALSIVTYALVLQKSSLATYAFNALNSRSVTEGNFRYWQSPSAEASSFSGRWRPPYLSTPTNDIEMTSYALLSYVNQGDVNGALPILRWLVSKQNDLGGYSSTQDTVLAIQALSQIAALLTERSQNLSLTFRHSDDEFFEESLTITNENENVFYSYMVPEVNGEILLSAQGSGVGVAQLSVCYNTPNDPYEDEPFNCSVDVQNTNNDQITIEFCCSLSKEMEKTGMFIFEVGLLNGFSTSVEQTELINEKAKLVELEDGDVNIYFDQLPPGQGLCAIVELKRSEEVAATKPAVLSAYDYYKPDRKVSRLYTADGLSETGVCQVCGSSCVGCEAAQLLSWSPWAECTEFCREQEVSRVRSCYDPNLGHDVSSHHCNTNEITIETRLCPVMFSCPDAEDGFWYQLPSSFNLFRSGNICSVQRQFVPSQRFSITSIFKSPQQGIPGQTLVDSNREFIRCFTDLAFAKISRSTPFTISLLVRPNSFDDSQAVFLAIGRNSEQPIVVLEKPEGIDSLSFRVEAEMMRFTVTDIPILPIGQWSHVIVSWSVLDGASVFVNGSSIGKKDVIEEGVKDRRRAQGFFVGKSSNLNNGGYLNATVSSMKLWLRVLPSSETISLSDFYRNLLNYPLRDQLLTVSQLRSFAFRTYRNCIKSPSTLASIFSNPPPCKRSTQNEGPIFYL